LLSRKLGRRRGWLILCQAMLIAVIIGLAFTNPTSTPLLLVVFAVLIAFFSASQDIVIDAYRIETLEDEEQGIGAAAATYGYRVGMLAAGAGVLLIADAASWMQAYLVMAGLMLVGVVTVLLSPEPEGYSEKPTVADGPAHQRARAWIADHVIAPLAEFSTRHGWAVILAFIVTFKLGDAFLSVMTNPFYIDIGFTKTEIAEVTKVFGLIATFVGLFLGGVMIQRIGLLRALLIAGILQAASNLVFAYQVVAGADVGVLVVTIAVENITGGIGTAAFVAYLSALTNIAFTATQFALLSAIMALGRTVVPSASGWLVDMIGWFDFFIVSVAVAAPGLVLLVVLMRWYPDHAGRRTQAGGGEERARDAGGS